MGWFRKDRLVLVDGNRVPRATDPQWAPPGLVAVRDVADAAWVERAMTTFALNVASFLPGHYEAYARIFHPFGDVPGALPWRALAAREGRVLDSADEAEFFAIGGLGNPQAEIGALPRVLMDPLLAWLRPATGTPASCRFAVWEGRQSVLSPRVTPVLTLPIRAYYLFAGPIDGVRATYDYSSPEYPFPGSTTANLWWPADRAWFVCTEVDFAWTYVGGTRACVDAILADRRLEAEETTATSRW